MSPTDTMGDLGRTDKLVFLCGVRDFHAMDWYRRACEKLPDGSVSIITDLMAGEGFTCLAKPEDRIHRLVIIDRLLFRHQSRSGDRWRNLVKAVVLPLQVLLLRRFARTHPKATFYAHSMYYMLMAAMARVPYVGRPQGDDVLCKPVDSRLYRYCARKAIEAANGIIVDSDSMRDNIGTFCRRTTHVHVVRNGIDIEAIRAAKERHGAKPRSNAVLSIRAFAELYRIEDILRQRNESSNHRHTPISLVYPFHDGAYMARCRCLHINSDRDLGRLSKKHLYGLLHDTQLVVSIPRSDSCPRSVFEAVFCGCAVAIAHHSYFDALPACMQRRIILIDPSRPWFDYALAEAERITTEPYEPSAEAREQLDQSQTIQRMLSVIFPQHIR